jgi:hypothetical protein
VRTYDSEPLAPEDDPHAGFRRRVEESRVRFRVDELVGMTISEARTIV